MVKESSLIGKLLQARGYKVTIQKFDPYINIDPGTLNPYEHGECYVTEDGFETDLDLGHYERFTGIHTTRNNSITTGRIYKTVIDRERHGDYIANATATTWVRLSRWCHTSPTRLSAACFVKTRKTSSWTL